MIPRLAKIEDVRAIYLDFIQQLKTQGFEGDLSADYSDRTVLATDNSIYQLLPQGVLYPRNTEDLQRIAQLCQQPDFHAVVITPRGGGTGTNGQSLTDGLVVDLSRHMNNILEINAEERWVRVQGGVVKDQLNAALKPYSLFFAPELSTSNRATVGGMINTDASGQGSCLYGKTRDHVLELGTVLLDGTFWQSRPLEQAALHAYQQRQDLVGELHRLADGIFRENRDLINSRFPRLNRCLTGYDLAHIYDESGRFNLNSLLCGSEGTLGFIAEARLNVLPIPKHAALVTVMYESFDASLRDAHELMQAGPTSIETIDAKVLGLAMEDIVWETVRDYFPETPGYSIQGINLVEYTADSREELEQKLAVLTTSLNQVKGQPGKCFGYTPLYGQDNIKKVWGMRKKAVGLLGNGSGERRPVPFVEDCAVPPENLADFIQEFRALLDARGMEYGMFGHVDAGVLHVRPALDMKDEAEAEEVRKITDGVVSLAKKYHGLLWGEHGKGVRSEYAPEFFGPELYSCLQRIKGAFDPRNQLNPGKICTPAASDVQLLKIDGVPTRGEHDRQIPAPVRVQYQDVMSCNGNGGCFNYDPDDAMCPSWKGTRKRQHSPKGRASLVREWLRQLSEQGADPVRLQQQLHRQGWFKDLWAKSRNTLARNRGEYDFSHEVHEAMQDCLACKTCASQCPIKVNVPDFRSRFFELYYSRYLRPVKDYLIGSLEFTTPLLARWPGLYNAVTQSAPGKTLFRKALGMVDNPPLCKHGLKQGLTELGISFADPELLAALSEADKKKSVIIVQDAFTSYFETRLVLDCCELLQRFGFRVFVAPYTANGKALHVHGFLAAFEKTARKHIHNISRLAASGIPLVGIEPSMTLVWRQEYVKALPESNIPRVQLLQEWLSSAALGQLSPVKKNKFQLPFKLLSHCTEKTSYPAAAVNWKSIFNALGLILEPVATGCCGMAGTYGHETRNLETSRRIYDLSWAGVLQNTENQSRLMATGYSCRSQVKRFEQQQLPHPAQILLQAVKGNI
ncbi:D-2-hydroxyglutarate dehydrogenase YdiJ [Endozoicomonadaceae bacterium StTr2]